MILDSLLNQLSPLLCQNHEGFQRFAQQYLGDVIAIRLGPFHKHLYIHQSGLHVCERQTSPLSTIHIHIHLEGKKRYTLSIEGDQKMGIIFCQLLTKDSMNLFGLLDDILPSPGALFAIESINAIKKTTQCLKGHAKNQTIDFICYEKGWCVTQQEANRQYEEIFHLKTMVEQLKSY